MGLGVNSDFGVLALEAAEPIAVDQAVTAEARIHAVVALRVRLPEAAGWIPRKRSVDMHFRRSIEVPSSDALRHRGVVHENVVPRGARLAMLIRA